MKNIIITAVISVLVTVFCFHAYELYQIRAVTLQNTQAIQQIADFLNKGIEAQKVAQPQPAQK